MKAQKFNKLVEIMKRLRKECPWDREQTNNSIKAATLEEAYEVVEAIDNKDFKELKTELGDLLLHIVFHSTIAEEKGEFTIENVIDAITEKLIRRHPHVFGNVKVNGNEDVMRNWETIKLSEGRDSVVEGVPKNIPQLYRAFRLQEKVSKIGFDWENKEDVWEKVMEELNEFKTVEKSSNQLNIEAEFGDIIFSLVNYARFIGINPENALRKTNNKFIKRFRYIENKLKTNGKTVIDSDLEEMDKYWEESKFNIK